MSVSEETAELLLKIRCLVTIHPALPDSYMVEIKSKIRIWSRDLWDTTCWSLQWLRKNKLEIRCRRVQLKERDQVMNKRQSEENHNDNAAMKTVETSAKSSGQNDEKISGMFTGTGKRTGTCRSDFLSEQVVAPHLLAV